MNVRFDAGSEVHALGADIWAAMRMASSVALVLAMPFPAMFGRRNGVGHAASSFVKHSTIRLAEERAA
jgi:hypothetical protein